MWEVELYPPGANKSPIADFLSNLQKEARIKINNHVKLLTEYGSNLREPYSKKIAGYNKLFELRSSGKTPIRLLYTIHNNKFIILNAFVKQTNKTPQNEIKTAISRMSNLT